MEYAKTRPTRRGSAHPGMANRERLIAEGAGRRTDVGTRKKAAQKKTCVFERHLTGAMETNSRYMKKPEVLARGAANLTQGRSTRTGQRKKALREHYRDTLHDCFVRRCLAQHLKDKRQRDTAATG